MKNSKVVWIWRGLAVILCFLFFAYSLQTYLFVKNDPLASVVECVNGNTPYFPRVCKQGIYWFRAKPDEINRLNTHTAGRSFDDASFVLDAILQLKDRSQAEELLVFLVKRGLNINDPGMLYGFTILHSIVMDNDVVAAKMFIQYGAKADIKNQKGETALQFAERYQREKTNEDRSELIRLLIISNQNNIQK